MSAEREPVQVAVLGPVRIWRGQHEFDAGPPLQRAVLVVLTLRANQVVSRSELIEAVWQGNAPATAEGSIYTYMSGLRRLLEPGRADRGKAQILVGDRSGYSLRLPAEHIDITQMRAHHQRAQRAKDAGDLIAAAADLDAALALWSGDPLSRVPGPFAEAERARLIEERLNLVEDRAEIRLSLGGHADVAAALPLLVREQPLRERLRELLMLALYRCGRRTEALAEFRNARDLLADELGLDPSPVLRELHERILRADPLLEPGQPVPSESTAQLPDDPTTFTGRAIELAELRAWVSRLIDKPTLGTVMISAIDGAVGVGKTALAVHFAHTMSRRYPDGQLFLDLGASSASLTSAEALARALDVLGVPVERIPAEVEERSALYRSLLAGTRTLILLDDAASSDQVRPLLPGDAGCLVVVTSRKRLGGLAIRDGAHRLTVEPMDHRSALDLLAALLGTSRVEADVAAAGELIRLCGGLPLALRSAAEQVSRGRVATIRALVDRLHAETSLLGTAVEGCLPGD